MSDLGRKGFGDKASEAVKPDSQKGVGEKLTEGATDIGDKVSRSVQPDDSKSGTQKVGDSLSGSKDQATSGGTSGGIVDKAKDTLGLQK